MIIAKPVVPNQYWILKQDDRKIGNIKSGPDGIQVCINNNIIQFTSIKKLKQQVQINFEPVASNVISKNNIDSNVVYGYRTTGRAFNAVFDVQHKIPLWTKSPKSRSWYAAGWYMIQQSKSWKIVNNPKFILLQRYRFRGPFHSREEAHDQSIQ